MAEEILRNNVGQIIGKIKTDRDGNRTLRDFNGRILGEYKKKSNQTFNFLGQLIGTGDQLARLLNS